MPRRAPPASGSMQRATSPFAGFAKARVDGGTIDPPRRTCGLQLRPARGREHGGRHRLDRHLVPAMPASPRCAVPRTAAARAPNTRSSASSSCFVAATRPRRLTAAGSLGGGAGSPPDGPRACSRLNECMGPPTFVLNDIGVRYAVADVVEGLVFRMVAPVSAEQLPALRAQLVPAGAPAQPRVPGLRAGSHSAPIVVWHRLHRCGGRPRGARLEHFHVR